jgi:crossover junction endodeoxyribonuclease RusA
VTALTALTVTVLGEPIPQGSMRAVGRGRMISDNVRLRPWRDTVAWHVRQECMAAGLTEPLTGPLAVAVTFTLPRPKSAPKRRWAPDRKPDGDKLERALFDAITAGGAWVDDAQVVKCEWSKAYPPPGAVPGVTFTVAPAERGEQVAA